MDCMACMLCVLFILVWTGVIGVIGVVGPATMWKVWQFYSEKKRCIRSHFRKFRPTPNWKTKRKSDTHTHTTFTSTIFPKPCFHSKIWVMINLWWTFFDCLFVCLFDFNIGIVRAYSRWPSSFWFKTRSKGFTSRRTSGRRPSPMRSLLGIVQLADWWSLWLIFVSKVGCFFKSWGLR